MNRLVRRIAFPLCVLPALAGFGSFAHSQQFPIDASTLTPFATGLNGPHGLAFGPDNQLYVAEGGTGDSASTAGACAQVPAPVGPYTGGATARI